MIDATREGKYRLVAFPKRMAWVRVGAKDASDGLLRPEASLVLHQRVEDRAVAVRQRRDRAAEDGFLGNRVPPPPLAAAGRLTLNT